MLFHKSSWRSDRERERERERHWEKEQWEVAMRGTACIITRREGRI